MASSVIEIDLDRILDKALWGVRRASIFMGLGLNAALDPAFKAYSLSKISVIQFAPEQVDDGTLAHFKESFAHWIVNNAVRELMEPFAQFLDDVYRACLHVSVSKNAVTPEDAKKLYARFLRRGIDEKHQELNDRFCVRPDHTEHINSLHFARNCIAHRSSRVSSKDCGSHGKLVLRWIGLDLTAVTPKGGRVPLDNPMQPPVYFPEGADLEASRAERSLEFGVGEVIVVAPKYAAEMCNFVADEARSLGKSALEYAQRSGARVEVSAHPGAGDGRP